jgi:hypothetical protein
MGMMGSSFDRSFDQREWGLANERGVYVRKLLVLLPSAEGHQAWGTFNDIGYEREKMKENQKLEEEFAVRESFG